jgi:hypothetical protein
MTAVTTTNPQNQQYSMLIPPNINPQPILYFGDPLTAEFATFGVNPAAAELAWSRWSVANLTVQQLDARLVDYFKKPVVPPNDWFDGYERPSNGLATNKALNILGHSYRIDTVHLDFSPRATVPRSTAAKKLSTPDYKVFVQRFRQMVAADLQWFLSALAICQNLKAAIMAGAVTNDRRDYLDAFRQSHLPSSHSLKLRQLLGPKGPGATALYDFVGPQLSIPVFFVSSSPSGDQGVRLADEIQSHLSALKAAGF